MPVCWASLGSHLFPLKALVQGKRIRAPYSGSVLQRVLPGGTDIV